MKINEVARRTGVTVRTLHYYDQIGLLRPSEVTEAGYRLYDEAALARLQEILFFRELDFPLEEIRRIMESPGYDRAQALSHQRELLRCKQERLAGLMSLIDRILKGEKQMSFQEFDHGREEALRSQYAEEARQRWGQTDEWKENQRRMKDYGQSDWSRFGQEADKIFSAFAALRTAAPDSAEARALVRRWQAFITDKCYPCSDEMLATLGQMYVADPRFTANLDRFGEGTADFMSRAIAAVCS